ncbi:MAG: rhomboid family intramembrane serine protease [Bacilli bacterium]|nr:rhomboid family intramembrane serine protease [Bacilli bacterium]
MEPNQKDLFVMKLIHYFMTKKNYSPIIIKGIDNEVWLENPKEEFRIVRIITKSIYNEEQFEFDVYKMKNIISQIKKKTFNPFVDVLTIYTKIGDNFSADIEDNKKYKYVVASSEEELYNNELIKKYYKDIEDSMRFDEEGFSLLGKIATDIGKKNIEENVRYNDMFKPSKPIVTYILIAINIIVFVLMYIFGKGSEDNETLINFGAIVPSLVHSGEYYRLITNAFLHIGIMHLVFNMYSLFVLGPNIEHLFGKGKYICIYLFSAIMGSLFALVFQGPNTITAGASGAIFGLLGSLLYFGYNFKGYLGNRLLNQILPVVIVNLIISFTMPGISAAAHIGGLLGGASVSFMLGAGRDDKSSRITGLIMTLVLTGFMIYMAFFK